MKTISKSKKKVLYLPINLDTALGTKRIRTKKLHTRIRLHMTAQRPDTVTLPYRK